VGTELKLDRQLPHELSFPPPFAEHARYLELADKFLHLPDDSEPAPVALEDRGELVQPIDSSKYFNQAKSKQAKIAA
jgi:hypothetical protein